MSNIDDFVIEDGKLTKYKGSGGNVIIPEGVTSIGKNAFAICTNLTSVVFPDSVTTVGNAAFINCIRLTNISFTNSITKIGDGVFSDCSSLTSIVFPVNTKKIGSYMFYCCNNLSNVIIPEGVSSIGEQAFVNCNKLQWIISPVIPTSKVAPSVGFALLLCGKKKGYFAYSAKANKDNIKDFAKPKKWNQYDLELINNGPVYKYKVPARLIGALGRLLDPVELTDEVRDLYIELLGKNAKKLVPIAEESGCVDIIKDLFSLNILDNKTEKAVKKLLAASTQPELAALVE